VVAQHRRVAVRAFGGVEHDLAVAQLGKFRDARVHGVEHAHAVGEHHVDLRAQHLVQLVRFGHIVPLQALGAVEVGHHAHVAAVVGQALVQDQCGAVLEHGGLGVAVHQQAVAGFPVGAAAGHVGALDAALPHEQAVAARQGRVLARQVHQPGDGARHHMGVARAGHTHDGNAPRVRVVLLAREQLLDDGLAHGPRFAHGGLQVHQQAGAGVDLDHGAALGLQGPRDVLGHHVHAGDVQAHHLGGQADAVGDFWVHLVRAVDGDIAVALHQHPVAGRRHAVGREALALQVEQDHRVLAHVQAVERVVFGGAAARVGVDLQVDQLRDGVLAVAGDPGRLAARGGDELAAHDEQPVFAAGDATLHHHLAAFLGGQAVGRLDVVLLGQVERHAAAVVAVGGLDGHRAAHVLRRGPGRLGAVDDLALGHRHAAALQQRLGEVLVAGDGLGDGAGEVGLGRPDAALLGAIAQLHQVAVVEPDVRDAPVGGRRHDAGGGRAQVAVVDGLAHLGHGGGHVEGLVVDGRHQQGMALGQRHPAHLLVARPEDHAVDAGLAGAARLAEAGGHAAQVEQLDDAVFQDVAGPGALAQALQEAASLAHPAMVLGQGRQQRQQPVGEAGQLVGGVVLQFAEIEPDLEHRSVGPDVGAAQVGDALERDVVLPVGHGADGQWTAGGAGGREAVRG
jgi:hypothetical protein